TGVSAVPLGGVVNRSRGIGPTGRAARRGRAHPLQSTGIPVATRRQAATGGEEGIRTLDTAFQPYTRLAGGRLRPLGHLSVEGHSPAREARARDIRLICRKRR